MECPAPPPIPPKDLSRLDSNAILALESVELSPILLDLSACFMDFFFFLVLPCHPGHNSYHDTSTML